MRFPCTHFLKLPVTPYAVEVDGRVCLADPITSLALGTSPMYLFLLHLAPVVPAAWGYASMCVLGASPPLPLAGGSLSLQW